MVDASTCYSLSSAVALGALLSCAVPHGTSPKTQAPSETPGAEPSVPQPIALAADAATLALRASDRAPNCPAPLTDCAGTCVDLQTEPKHCGSCSSGCEFPCTGGRCPTAVSEGPALAVGPTGMYTAGSGGLYRAPLGALPDGGTPVVLVPSRTAAGAVTLDATSVYWVDNAAPDPSSGGVASVLKAPLLGGSVTTLAVAGPVAISELLVDSRNVYWSGRSVKSVPIGGGPVTKIASSDGSYGQLAKNSTSLFWNGHRGITAIPLLGGRPRTIVAQLPAVSFAADESNVYWITNGFDIRRDQCRVAKAPLAGGVTTTLASGSCGDAIAVDSKNLYWTTRERTAEAEPGASTVVELPLDGGEAVTLARSIPGGDLEFVASVIQLDSAYVYFAAWVHGTALRQWLRVPK